MKTSISMATATALLGLVLGMTPAARLADDRVRERARRLAEPAPTAYRRPTRDYSAVTRTQEQARRLRQRAHLEAKRALRAA